MRNVSLGFLEEVVKPSRTVDAKIVINGYTITSNDIISYYITSSLTDNDMPTIGSAVASSVKFEVTKSSLPMIYVGQKLEFYAGLLVNGAMEWVRVGTFKTTAEYVTKKKLTVEIEAFDEMFWYGDIIFQSALTYPVGITDVANELALTYGVKFKKGSTHAFLEQFTHAEIEIRKHGDLDIFWFEGETEYSTFNLDPTQSEYSIRSILAQIALIGSANAIINDDGEVEFRFTKDVDFEVTADNYIDYKELSETNVGITQLIVENEVYTGRWVSGTSDGLKILVQNEGITSQLQTDEIYNRVYPIYFKPYEMTCQGFPQVEVGDNVKFTELDGVQERLLVVNHSLTYNGGFSSKFLTNAPLNDIAETSPFKTSTTTVTKTLNDKIVRVETTLDGKIELKVSQEDYTGEVIASLINVSPTEVAINAQHIKLEGLVTANNNFKVLLDGSIEAVNGKFSGNISGSSINGGTINIGSGFSVDANGNLVASNAILSGSITATKMVAPNGEDYYGEIGVTSGLVGFGLFDRRYSSEAFFEVLSTINGSGFSLRDRNNYTRFQAGVDYTVIRDNSNIARFQAGVDHTVIRDNSDIARFQAGSNDTLIRDVNNENRLIIGQNYSQLTSPDGNTYIYVSNGGIDIVVDGITVQSW